MQWLKSAILPIFPVQPFLGSYELDTVTDFLIKLGMKLCLHLVEISIFSLNNVTVRLTKIMNNLLEHVKILIFKVLKIGQIFPNLFL